MALNATLGASDANSYVTRAEADAYMANRAFVSARWAAFTASVKEQFLITASQMIDWYLSWKGDKAEETQSMEWPRLDAIRKSGYEILETELPSEVKVAVYEMAISLFDADRTEDDPLAGIGQLKVSSLMIKAGPEYPNQTTKKVIPEKVKKILKDLITSYGGIYPLLRM